MLNGCLIFWMVIKMKILEKILDVVFPPYCLLCTSRIDVKNSLCADCRRRFALETFEKCERCGKICAKCQCGDTYTKTTKTTVGASSHYTSVFYKKAAILGDNSTRVSERMIFSLKGKGEFVDFFAETTAAGLKKMFSDGGEDITEWIVTYPPRSRERMREFGFDHAEKLARGVAKRLGIPCVSLFKRTRGGEVQKTLSAEERTLNASQSLEIIESRVVRGGKYILIDDIITTGATMDAAARKLYFYSAEKVFPVAIAKSMHVKSLRRE